MHIHNILGVLLLSTFSASAQTLYEVSHSEGTMIIATYFTVSAAGVGADGGTTYVEVGAVPTGGISDASTTVTAIITPFTYTATLVADASGFRATPLINGHPGNIIETCGFGTDARATCVEGVFGGLIATFTGDLVPFYTLAAATPAPTSTGTSPAPSPTSSSPPSRGISLSPSITRFSASLLVSLLLPRLVSGLVIPEE
ncbi:hypothetical protein DFH09DRAFT_1089899 [Mycena vulgaris]|nr:hypothetical protein DFH09DRAFT_1089899 [Mycena vulgaris]